MPHCKAEFVPDERADYEQINTQWSGWLYLDNCQATTNATNCFNLNTGNTAVAEVNHINFLKPTE